MTIKTDKIFVGQKPLTHICYASIKVIYIYIYNMNLDNKIMEQR